MSDKDELKACPFCGGTAAKQIDKSLYYIECINCECRTARFFEELEAHYAWNRRANDERVGR